MCMSCVSLAGGWVDRVDGLESGHGLADRSGSSHQQSGCPGVSNQLKPIEYRNPKLILCAFSFIHITAVSVSENEHRQVADAPMLLRDDASSAHLVQFRLATTCRLRVQELTYEAESSGLFGLSTGMMRRRCGGRYPGIYPGSRRLALGRNIATWLNPRKNRLYIFARI